MQPAAARTLARLEVLTVFCLVLGTAAATALAQDAAPEDASSPVEATVAPPTTASGTADGLSPEEASPSVPPGDATAAATTSAVSLEDVSTDDTGAATATPPPVRVHVRARRPGVELHVRLGSHVVVTDGISRTADDYTLVCAPAPCDADVPSGTHLFAVSHTEGTPLPARDVALPPGLEHTLEIDLVDRSGWRTLGTLVALIVGIPGVVVLAVSLIAPAVERSRVDGVFVAVGAPLTALGIAALPLAAWGDTREVELVDPEATE